MRMTRSSAPSVARRSDDPPVRNYSKLTFVSVCPKCGHPRFQHGYTRRTLAKLLNMRRKIDAYCMDCNVCWPISESERRSIASQ